MEIKSELRRYLSAKRWAFKPAPGSPKDIAIKVCPFCGKDKWKFWIDSQRTLYHCWHCKAKGNLYRLKRALGDLDGAKNAAVLIGGAEKKTGKPIPMKHVEDWHKRLLKSKVGMGYCRDRGLTKKTVKHFKLGLQIKSGKRWLAIPHIVDGVCKNVKFRTLPPEDKAFRRVKGSESVLFNSDVLADCNEVIVTEAELDAISFHEAGVKNVISLTCGADTLLDDWYDVLSDKEVVYLALDTDAVGQSGARDIARRLGFDRCKNILLPDHDANSCLTSLGPESLVSVIDTAEDFEVGGVVTAADVMLRCKYRDEIGETGLLTPWAGVNRVLGTGFHPGDLWVLSARIKVGKTTLAINQALHLATLGIPSCIHCLEMSVERLGMKLAALLRCKPVDDLTNIDFAMARYMLRKIPLYFIEPDWSGELSIDSVFGKIRDTAKRHGIKFLVFDHLHFLCRSLKYVVTEVGQVTRAFKLLSEELQMTTCLIAQPKKMGSARIMITYDDIKDSSAIPADADWVMLLHRDSRPASLDNDLETTSSAEVLDPKTIVRIDAARFRGGGDCWLWFSGETSTFLDWADRPVDQLR
jgi:twinkle protein